MNDCIRLVGCPTYSLTRVYICRPSYQENFKYEKKGLDDFVRLKPNPTYRVSDLSSLPMYVQISKKIIGHCPNANRVN